MKKTWKKNTKGNNYCIDDDSSDSGSEPVLADDSDMDVDDEDTECMFRHGLYSEDIQGEQWIRCMKCFKWSHEECANSDKEKKYL
ncbi:hypothetical protein JTB14_011552 [Gonioctena quinquepunctata]|nr:hypothetical protein JTB14_011552 [Gonioctena quinquepunctata]